MTARLTGEFLSVAGQIALICVVGAAVAVCILIADAAADAIRDRRQPRTQAPAADVGDDVVNEFCLYCSGYRHRACACLKDCKRHGCPWAIWNTVASDRKFARRLNAMIDAEGGRE